MLAQSEDGDFQQCLRHVIKTKTQQCGEKRGSSMSEK